MAHELDIKENGEAAMMYVGETPWHRSGTQLDNPATAEEAIVAAGMGWGVTKKDTFMQTELGYKKVKNRQVVIRTDRDEVLGYVAPRYKPIQNVDAFKFFDHIIGEGKAIYHTAGSLKGGRNVWILAKLPETVEVANVDLVEQYLLLTNSHTGASALKVLFTPVRVVCANTLGAAINTQGTKANVWHVGDLNGQFREASELLGIAAKTFHMTAQLYNALAKIQLNSSEAREYFNTLVPVQPNAKISTRPLNIRQHMLYLFEGGKGNDQKGIRGTAWAAYNAVTEYIDHYRIPHGMPERRLWSSWFASGNTLRQKALVAATALIV